MHPPFMLENVTVVMVTYNQLEMFRTALFSMMTYSDFPIKTIVMNNNSNPAYISAVDKAAAQVAGGVVQVVHLKENVRDTGAYNSALPLVKTKYVAMMSDDIVFIPGCGIRFWEDMLRVLQHPVVAAVGPGNATTFYTQHACAWELPYVIEVPFLHGFFVLFKTAVYKSIGGYDTKVLRGPDLDLSYRLTQAGYKLVVVRTSFVHHVGGATYKELLPDYDKMDATKDAAFNSRWPAVDTWDLFNVIAWNP